MKTNFRDKFRDFLASEEGQVGAKAPLALGVATGSLLLAQAMLPASTQAHGNHIGCPVCPGDLVCEAEDTFRWSPGCGCWIYIGTHYSCVEP